MSAHGAWWQPSAPWARERGTAVLLGTLGGGQLSGWPDCVTERVTESGASLSQLQEGRAVSQLQGVLGAEQVQAGTVHRRQQVSRAQCVWPQGHCRPGEWRGPSRRCGDAPPPPGSPAGLLLLRAVPAGNEIQMGLGAATSSLSRLPFGHRPRLQMAHSFRTVVGRARPRAEGGAGGKRGSPPGPGHPCP